MKATFLNKYENMARKTILWTRNTNFFTIFLVKTFGDYTVAFKTLSIL